MKPLVSVIVPNYNYAVYLHQRIESILNQSYKNIELILLDDCSTDASIEILEKYRSDDRVKEIIYNTENSGSTFKQWKRGFEKASGEYIWIAECDDYSDTSFLEKIISRMLTNKDIKIGFSNSYWVTPESTFINKDYTVQALVKVYEGKSFIMHHLLKENFIYNASMAVFRKDALSSIDHSFENFRSCGDKLFWASIAHIGKVVFVCEPLNYFRIHNNKVTTKSIMDGTLFKEEHELFKKNIEKRYINLRNRWSVAHYFIKYVERMKKHFQSEMIYEECMQLWSAEVDFRNENLPLIYRSMCLIKKGIL